MCRYKWSCGWFASRGVLSVGKWVGVGGGVGGCWLPALGWTRRKRIDGANGMEQADGQRVYGCRPFIVEVVRCLATLARRRRVIVEAEGSGCLAALSLKEFVVRDALRLVSRGYPVGALPEDYSEALSPCKGMKCAAHKNLQGLRRDPRSSEQQRLPMVDKPTLVRSWMVTLFPECPLPLGQRCTHRTQWREEGPGKGLFDFRESVRRRWQPSPVLWHRNCGP